MCLFLFDDCRCVCIQEKARKFKQRREAHYNEFKALQEWRDKRSGDGMDDDSASGSDAEDVTEVPPSPSTPGWKFAPFWGVYVPSLGSVFPSFVLAPVDTRCVVSVFEVSAEVEQEERHTGRCCCNCVVIVAKPFVPRYLAWFFFPLEGFSQRFPFSLPHVDREGEACTHEIYRCC